MIRQGAEAPEAYGGSLLPTIESLERDPSCITGIHRDCILKKALHALPPETVNVLHHQDPDT